MAERQRISIGIVFAIVVLMVLGSYVFKKPIITGRVTEGGETIFNENLNLQANESGTYEWDVKNPGSIKSLKMSGSVSTNGSAKVYIEKNGTRQLLFDSSKQLFDVDIHVLPEYKKIGQGDEILVQIVLFNLRGFGKGNVDVKYSIKDPKGNIVAAQQESVFIETQAKFVRSLLIPAEMKPGTYTTFVEAAANTTIVGTGSDTFEVQAKFEEPFYLQAKYYLIALAAAVALLIASLLGIQQYKKAKKKKAARELKEKAPLEKAIKLQAELTALETAYKSGFMSNESYTKEKKRIEERISSIKK